MPYRATFVLHSERDRGFALAAVMRAPIGMQVRISKPTRSDKQNALLHSCLTDISKQLHWPPPPRNDGRLYDVTWWKRRVTFTWLREGAGAPELIGSLNEGEEEEFGLLVPHTSDLTTEQMSALCEFVFAFGSTNGVEWTMKPKNGPEPPPREEVI